MPPIKNQISNLTNKTTSTKKTTLLLNGRAFGGPSEKLKKLTTISSTLQDFKQFYAGFGFRQIQTPIKRCSGPSGKTTKFKI